MVAEQRLLKKKKKKADMPTKVTRVGFKTPAKASSIPPSSDSSFSYETPKLNPPPPPRKPESDDIVPINSELAMLAGVSVPDSEIDPASPPPVDTHPISAKNIYTFSVGDWEYRCSFSVVGTQKIAQIQSICKNTDASSSSSSILPSSKNNISHKSHSNLQTKTIVLPWNLELPNLEAFLPTDHHSNTSDLLPSSSMNRSRTCQSPLPPHQNSKQDKSESRYTTWSFGDTPRRLEDDIHEWLVDLLGLNFPSHSASVSMETPFVEPKVSSAIDTNSDNKADTIHPLSMIEFLHTATKEQLIKFMSPNAADSWIEYRQKLLDSLGDPSQPYDRFLIDKYIDKIGGPDHLDDKPHGLRLKLICALEDFCNENAQSKVWIDSTRYPSQFRLQWYAFIRKTALEAKQLAIPFQQLLSLKRKEIANKLLDQWNFPPLDAPRSITSKDTVSSDFETSDSHSPPSQTLVSSSSTLPLVREASTISEPSSTSPRDLSGSKSIDTVPGLSLPQSISAATSLVGTPLLSESFHSHSVSVPPSPGPHERSHLQLFPPHSIPFWFSHPQQYPFPQTTPFQSDEHSLNDSWSSNTTSYIKKSLQQQPLRDLGDPEGPIQLSPGTVVFIEPFMRPLVQTHSQNLKIVIAMPNLDENSFSDTYKLIEEERLALESFLDWRNTIYSVMRPVSSHRETRSNLLYSSDHIPLTPFARYKPKYTFSKMISSSPHQSTHVSLSSTPLTSQSSSAANTVSSGASIVLQMKKKLSGQRMGSIVVQ